MPVEQFLVFHASRYDFVSDKGEKLTGCKLTVLNKEGIDKENQRGIPVGVQTGPFEMFHEMRVLPGIYDLDIDVVMKGGKFEAVLKGAKFIRAATTAGDTATVASPVKPSGAVAGGDSLDKK